MNPVLVGRGLAAVGVSVGFVAIFVDLASAGGTSVKYSDDGTILVFLLVTLTLTALALLASFAGRDGLEVVAAIAGSAACGFYLLIPSGFGFNHFDVLGTGAWLGVCTGLIPLGLWLSLSSRDGPLARTSIELAAPAVVARIMCLVAIWLTVERNLDLTYWNLVDEGRALPLLMLLLVIGGAVFGASTVVSPTRFAVDGVLIVGAVTFGLYGAEVIQTAFNDFGDLGAGAWLGAAGGTLLLVSVFSIWKHATGATPVGETPPAVASPPG
jgi:hypothetical protein